ncbi:MAG: adenine phosphoribosyltransferase [Candidatus Melainabacteria bacterium]
MTIFHFKNQFEFWGSPIKVLKWIQLSFQNKFADSKFSFKAASMIFFFNSKNSLIEQIHQLQMSTLTLEQNIIQTLRDVPDFPKKGIIFKDITPILSDPKLFDETLKGLVSLISEFEPTHIAGIEARGFIFGAPVAREMKLPFVPIRKPGKLPWKTKQKSYSLEYGEATIEIHEDALDQTNSTSQMNNVAQVKRVVVIDDLLATGGTSQASCELIQAIGGEVVACAFVVELAFLKGRDILEGLTKVKSLAIIS